jgi:hypothetical protein
MATLIPTVQAECYLIAALPIDSNYNYNFIAWNTINASVAPPN